MGTNAAQIQYSPLRRQATAEFVRLQMALYDVDGRPGTPADRTATVPLVPGPGNQAPYQVLWSIDVEPGQYQVRVTTEVPAREARGSVVASVTVPDFAREDVSLSGLLLAGGPAVPTEGADAFGDLVPVVPTTERLFDSSDTVTVFGRLYQRDRRPRPIMVTTRVVDASGAVVHEASETVAAERFGAGGAADVTWPLPLATLIPGAYELQVVATLDRERTATRTATFGVRGRE